MKTAINCFRVLVIMLIIALSFFRLSAQDWETHSNNADSTEFIGIINYHNLLIKTDIIYRIIIVVNDIIYFIVFFFFNRIKIPLGFLYADSIRVQSEEHTSKLQSRG